MVTAALQPDAPAPVKSILKTGLYVPFITTFDASEALDTGALRAVLEYQLGAGVDGLVAAGTTGEAHALSFEEREQVFRTAVKAAGGKVPVLAGSGATTTREAIRYIHLAEACGCTAALVLTPWFERPTPEALIEYYEEIVRKTTLPILLYNNPSRTSLEWPVEAIARLARALGDRVIGIKDSANQIERAQALRKLIPSDFTIFSGGPHQRDAFGAAGADSVIDGPTNLLASEGVAALRGDLKAREAVAAAYEIYDRSKNFVGLLKASMELAGLPAGKPRRPHDQVNPEELAELVQRLKKYGRMQAVSSDVKAEQPLPKEAASLAGFTSDTATLVFKSQTLFQPDENQPRYNHHPCLVEYGGMIFAAWSNGRIQEDSQGQTIHYTQSTDGVKWSPIREFVTGLDDPNGRWTAGGFMVVDGKLKLLATRYTSARYVDGEKTPGLCWEDMDTFSLEWSGAAWVMEGKAIENFYSNEAPRQLPTGDWCWPGVNMRHDVILAFSANGGPGTWTSRVISQRGEKSKLTEPSWYVAADGRIRVLLRDDGGSRRIWLSESLDGSTTWSTPVITDIPDAQSKFHSLRLPDGRIGMVGNATGTDLRRKLLTLLVSKDGRRFETCYTLRREPEIKPRFQGMHKAPGFQYPHAIIARNRLWVINSVNKEDIEIHTVEIPTSARQ